MTANDQNVARLKQDFEERLAKLEAEEDARGWKVKTAMKKNVAVVVEMTKELNEIKAKLENAYNAKQSLEMAGLNTD